MVVRGQAGAGWALRWAAGVVMMGPVLTLPAQTCTTQAKMAPEVRMGIGDTAAALAAAVKAKDSAKVQGMTVAEYASDFRATEYLIANTAPRLAGDSLEVTQVYALDAKGRRAGDTSDAEFSCALTGTTSETDFAIGGLPPGFYGFAMVEGTGSDPWLLAFLLRQDGGSWKMAGFYPRARAAAGHDGLWYWKTAREAAKNKNGWAAWLLFGEADTLLRPANFVTSTNLDKLRQEERTATPPEVSDGLSAATPLVLKAADGSEFRFTAVSAEGSPDGKKLNLTLHYSVDAAAMPDAEVSRRRNIVAAKTLLDAHKELRPMFGGVSIFADAAGRSAVATQQSMAEIP